MKTTKETILSGTYQVIHLDNNEIETFKIPVELINQVKIGMTKQNQIMAMIKLRAEKRRPKPKQIKTEPKQIEFRRIPNTLLWERIS